VAQQTLMARFSWTSRDEGLSAWTDGWEGYAPARQRLLQTIAQRKVPGVVVLGGDVHTHYVADLKTDFDDASSPVIASEFCGTSISSTSLPQDKLDAALRHNPHVHFARGDRRGYVRFRLDASRLEADLRVLDDARDPASAIASAARFVVDARDPGPKRA
jgi:alkaline phosphatase D